MSHRNRNVVPAVVVCIVVTVVGVGMLNAQSAPTVKRSILLKQAIPGRESPNAGQPGDGGRVAGLSPSNAF
jgi:hypothetical protein